FRPTVAEAAGRARRRDGGRLKRPRCGNQSGTVSRSALRCGFSTSGRRSVAHYAAPVAHSYPDDRPVREQEEPMLAHTSQIREHMQVLGSDAGLVGKVDKVEGLSIKLTKDSPRARGEHRYIPVDWVRSVDAAVHLTRPTSEVQELWQAHPVQEGEYAPEAKVSPLHGR